jgi:hypothetical protein
MTTRVAVVVGRLARAARQNHRLTRFGCAAASAVLLAAAGCTHAQVESGPSPVYAVLDQLSAASGSAPTSFGGSLESDVLTAVKKNINNAQVCVPTIFQDEGRATFHLQLKDPGSIADPTVPSAANTITFTRYHVKFIRADGRNVQGVDVPYEFDGGMTTSVVGDNVSIAQLVVVRAQAKQEAPLKALVGGGGVVSIATIAQVTFYGTDTAGRAVSVTGNIDVIFSDWADPDC